MSLGYTHLETDTRATQDGILLAFHDRTLDRVTDRQGRIARMPYTEVSGARIGGTEPIPLLADLLGSWPELRFNIDVKDAPVSGPLAEVIRRTGAWDRVCVTSFSGRRLGATRHALARRAAARPVCMATAPPGIGLIRYGVPARALAGRFARLSIRCTQIPYGMATPRYVRRARAAGLAVHVWTVNDPAVMADMLDIGVDGIMTDKTEVLRELMISRGVWNPQA